MLDNLQAIELAATVILLMFCIWLFISPFQSEEERTPEEDADDQTFTM